METCIEDVKAWLCNKGFVNKPEAIVICPPSPLAPISINASLLTPQPLSDISNLVSVAFEISNVCRYD